MSSKQHSALAVTAIIIGIIALTAMVVMIIRMGNGDAEASTTETTFSARASFVDGCIEGGATQSQCDCMYDGLLGDGTATMADLERMASLDLTDEEFDVIVGCAY